MSKLAHENNAINLSQGFPDFDGPGFLTKAATASIQNGDNQYSSYLGIEKLRKSISFYLNNFYKIERDSQSEVLVTTGATEALFCSISALINPGDEVLVIEPFYDSYVRSIEILGGIPVFCGLGDDLLPDLDALTSKITEKTKLLILNNPHNPTGKVFSQGFLHNLSVIVEKNDLYLLSDEVYEFLVFDDQNFFPSQTIDLLKERTITVCSAGKTFGMTGWKIGWAYGNSNLISKVAKVHQYTTFCVSTPMQHAISHGLDQLPSYHKDFKKLYGGKRDLLKNGLEKVGFEILANEGTYFLTAKYDKLSSLNSIDFSMKLIKECQVATIPLSPFYSEGNQGDHLIRFCFAKEDELLIKAINNLNTL